MSEELAARRVSEASGLRMSGIARDTRAGKNRAPCSIAHKTTWDALSGNGNAPGTAASTTAMSRAQGLIRG
jgi:hypothetical protein